MFRYQLIEKATEVIWMFLLISFVLFVDIWLRIFHGVSILEISNEWFESNFDISDGIGITVGFSFFMAAAIPGVRFILPLLFQLAYGYLCAWFNWKPFERRPLELGAYYIHEDSVRDLAVEKDNVNIMKIYESHIKQKESTIKQQTISQSIIFLVCLGYFLPSTSPYIIQEAYITLDNLVWYIDFPFRGLLAGFLFYTFMMCFGDYRYLEYIEKKSVAGAKKI
jgi:hypothetical protein